MSARSDFWRGRKVLLTGHTGFKGAWAWLWLEMLGTDLRGLALPPEGEPNLWTLAGGPGGEASFGDIRDRGSVEAVFAAFEPEIVIHMAAQALVHPSYREPVETFHTNVLGLVHVLEAARSAPSVRAVVNVTSDKCYENVEHLWAYRETEPMGGSDPYSASKGCAELVTTSYRRSFFNKSEGPQLASGRAGNVIGGGDWSADRLVPDCVRAFQAGSSVQIRNPLAVRPWQHVLEPVAGYLRLAQALCEQGAAVAEGWNFGPPSEEAWPVAGVADAVVRRWGEGAAWKQDPAAYPKEAMLLRVDATKARVRLGWRPQLTVDEAIAWTVDWYKQHQAGADVREITRSQIEAYMKLGEVQQ